MPGQSEVANAATVVEESGSAIQSSGRVVAEGAVGTGAVPVGRGGVALPLERGELSMLGIGAEGEGCGGNPPGEG